MSIIKVLIFFLLVTLFTSCNQFSDLTEDTDTDTYNTKIYLEMSYAMSNDSLTWNDNDSDLQFMKPWCSQFNKNNYPGLTGIYLLVNGIVPDPGNMGTIELYDAGSTEKTAIAGSQITFTNNISETHISGNVIDSIPDGEMFIFARMKSSIEGQGIMGIASILLSRE